ncbi:MAG TPA: hypothetical protein VMA73_21595, partial [Streptosporangiaceae bacterium]|nr:hypothetical protein [Streptosporangiaceae bacterium]
WHNSTISALNSGVNERRCRGFFPMLSMIGHPSGDKPLMMDVRQSGSGSPLLSQNKATRPSIWALAIGLAAIIARICAAV